jgi:hypothetical protein
VIQGGLGNQLFQIALVLSHAKNNNLNPVFINKNPEGDTKRQNYWQNLFRLLNIIQSNIINFNNIYNEHYAHLYQELPKFTDNTIINGYFQSGKYFKENEKIIRELIKPTNEEQIYIINKIDNIKNKYNLKLVSIHIRRTDYCTLNWVLDFNYYVQALNYFDINKCVFIIFSDDINWTLDKLSFLPNKEVISDKDYLELFMIGQCDEHIMANSSFSWWGVFFGDINKNKKVIVPKKWIPVNHNNYIFEDHWIKI